MSARAARSARPEFLCAECGAVHVKWAGRCGTCGAWGAVTEASPGRGLRAAGPVTTAAVPIGAVPAVAAAARPTGIGELDRVLGGGLVPGSVVLVAGEPGVGKSTLLLAAAARSAAPGHRTLLVTGEESAAQVRVRADRCGALADHLFLAAETDLGAVLAHVEAVEPALLIVDSVQTIAATDVDGAAGGVTQVREVAAALIRTAKRRGLVVLLVGHVTKDGGIAGPRVLEHLVDVVLTVEGDRHATLRLVRAVKNRYGPTDEVGCFELGETGVTELPDPSGLFLSAGAVTGDPPAADAARGPLLAPPGTAVTVTVEGRRPLVAEVQALVAGAAGPPRRAVSGLDSARVAMLAAVTERDARVPLGQRDVYAATVGGVRLSEPAADLAVVLALAAAGWGRPLRAGLIAVGEVTLNGELRPVPALARRLSEAARLGFRAAVVPAAQVPGAPGGAGRRAAAGPAGALDVPGIRLLPAWTVTEALAAAAGRARSGPGDAA